MSKPTHITTSTDKGAAPHGGKPQPPKMRAALRKAVTLIATKGMQVGKAAEQAGMNASALSRAINRPDVAAYLESQKAQFALDAHQLKGQAKAMAITEGIRLLHEATSEAVRARMVELFAGEDRQALVNVNINPQAASAYTYRKPGKNVAPIDSPSNAVDGQAIDITPLSESE